MSEQQGGDFFDQALQHECTIKLTDGTKYVGKLALYDASMNIVLSEATEYTHVVKDGKQESEYKENMKYPECFIRGNNGLFYKVYTNEQ